jgi:dehydrogenase/reductase SDR family protein 1
VATEERDTAYALSARRTAIVTGASRGIGRAIAIALGEIGSTVYVTGRTHGTGAQTIDSTADDVSVAGGVGVAVACDHHDDAQLGALFHRVREEQGRLDVLVNNVFPTQTELAIGDQPFFDQPLESVDDFLSVGLGTHYKATWHAAQLMRHQRNGLVVNVSSAGAVYSVLSPSYGIAKAGLDKFTMDAARHLRPVDVAVVSLWPGPLVGTETVRERLPERAHEVTESPVLTGRVVAALAQDPSVLRLTGRILVTTDVGAAYALVDGDGALPPYPFDDAQIARQLLRRAPLRLGSTRWAPPA